MSRATAMRMMRAFEPVYGKDDKNREHPIGIEKRSQVIPAMPREAKDCQQCGKPMMVSPGQIAKYHRECRKGRHNHSRVFKTPKLGDPMDRVIEEAKAKARRPDGSGNRGGKGQSRRMKWILLIAGVVIGISAMLGIQRVIYGQWAVPYVKYDEEWMVCERFIYPQGSMQCSGGWCQVMPKEACHSL